MNEVPSLENAIERLSVAVQELEASIDRQSDSDLTITNLQKELQKMCDDRSLIAESLDAATERTEQLENANQVVSKRLVSAMESIRSVLEGRGGQKVD